ncbi:hypothetical protein J5X98_05120 [Leptothermofonsia sichuanensis E412]|uniref:hypothetical protein n=1 Tax=Leptothermofonsia sichuanensis TaxID=2917832 RepID=UPI001CA6D2C1|nr:hypothetical protein [Leptothermofonsia sichuanensis]QZZ21820.1 hypothetical protein J5X98_05120 [Leptothermofonsia sichuanensis E412]
MPPPNPLLDAITDPAKNFLAFFAVSVVFFNVFAAGLSTLFWDNLGGWLQTVTGIQNEVLLRGIILLGLAILLLLAIYATNLTNGVRWLLRRLRLVDAVVPQDARVVPLTDTCQGLVAIMSLSDNSPAEVALRHHWNNGDRPHLRYCWLITTPDSLGYARSLHQRLIEEGIAEQITLFYGDYPLPDAADPQRQLTLTLSPHETNDPDAVLHRVNTIYLHAQQLGLTENDLIVDFTGGTKPLGVGAFLACTRPSRRLEYIAGRESPVLLEIKVDYQMKPVR